jgi:hypothetical protein
MPLLTELELFFDNEFYKYAAPTALSNCIPILSLRRLASAVI